MSRTRSTPLVFALIGTLILQLATPALAFADDGLPPPDPQAVEASPTDPLVGEEAPAPEPVEVVAEPEMASSPAEVLAEVLAEVPDETAVLVLDEAGEPEPLTTPEAAEAILTSDPEWCPAGDSPGDPTCTGGFLSISALLDEIGTDPVRYSGDGTIFFTTDYSTNDAYIRNTDARLAALQGLTINGLGHTLTVPLEIAGWIYDVAVTNLTLTGASLRVETEGAIQLTDVSVTGATGTGAYLDSTGGLPSNVSVSGTAPGGSQFNNNTWTGLDIRSDGDVNVASVIASGNAYGAYLDASLGSGNIALSNSTFNTNDAAGLTARTDAGGISLNGVTANNNATTSDAYGAGLTGLGGGTIDVSGGSLSGNAEKGLWIEASGPTTVQGVTANGNGLHGAYLHNLNACAAVLLPVTVDGGTFDGNGGYGVLAALGPGGDLTLAGAPSFSGNAAGDYLEDLSPCPTCEDKHNAKHKAYQVVHVPETGGAPVPLDCELYAGTVLILPSGDRATLVCPVRGEATLESLTDSRLPGVLPQGRTFVSGVDVGLTEGGVPLQAIFDGGFITLALPIPDGWADASLAVLYWDPLANGGAGGWVELPPFALRPDGTPMVHSLHPGAEPPDGMEILGGVRVLGGSVKIAVNFPGIFVLAAR